jgi:hypothetical protein
MLQSPREEAQRDDNHSGLARHEVGFTDRITAGRRERLANLLPDRWEVLKVLAQRTSPLEHAVLSPP